MNAIIGDKYKNIQLNVHHRNRPTVPTLTNWD